MAGIQFKILNRSKGPAVYVRENRDYFVFKLTYGKKGPGAQIDRKLYKKHMHEYLKDYPNLTIKAGSVADLVLNDGMTEKEYAQMIKKGASQMVKGVRLGKHCYYY